MVKTSRALYSKNVKKDQSEKTHLSPLQPEYPPCNSTRKYRFASIDQYLLYACTFILPYIPWTPS